MRNSDLYGSVKGARRSSALHPGYYAFSKVWIPLERRALIQERMRNRELRNTEKRF